MTDRWLNSRSPASGRTGQVVLRVELDASGTVHKIKIVDSFGPEMDALVAGFLIFEQQQRDVSDFSPEVPSAFNSR